jgi:methylglyoxal/glyoxal reductase
MELDLQSCVTLNSGLRMPLFGSGTWAATGSKCRQAVLWALEAGYRLIDTASSYGNEREVGEAVRASGLPRGEIFITSKVWPGQFGYDRTMRAFEESQAELGMGAIDLYLLHWPGDDRQLRAASWQALETLLSEGKVRAIGVSNYEAGELEEILEEGDGRVVPAVDQVPFSPFNQQKKIRSICEDNGIRIEGYSPLTRGSRLGDPQIVKVARAHGRTPAQVMIRWALQRGVITIPKSVHKERIIENAAVFDFELSAEDMAALDGLDRSR